MIAIKDFLEDLNPQLLTTIEAEFAKVDGQSAPEPTRFSTDVAAAPAGGAKGGAADVMEELFPRMDLEKLIGATTILTDAKSDQWKTRKEALELLQAILDTKANQRLKPNIGSLASYSTWALLAHTNLTHRRASSSAQGSGWRHEQGGASACFRHYCAYQCRDEQAVREALQALDFACGQCSS